MQTLALLIPALTSALLYALGANNIREHARFGWIQITEATALLVCTLTLLERGSANLQQGTAKWIMTLSAVVAIAIFAQWIYAHRSPLSNRETKTAATTLVLGTSTTCAWIGYLEWGQYWWVVFLVLAALFIVFMWRTLHLLAKC